MDRRIMLTAVPAILAGLAGCSGIKSAENTLATINTNLPVWVQDVSNIGADLSAAASDLKVITSIPADVVTRVQGWISDAKNLASRVEADVANAIPSGTLSSFAGTFLNIASALSGGKIGGTLGTVIQAGIAVLPSILSIAGIALAGPTPPSSMSEVQGRRVLAALRL